MSDYFFETRNQNQNQIPEKWAKLPDIGRSPEPRNDRAVVPYQGRGGGGGSYYNDGSGGGTDERMRELEERLMATEKSNRALLEEVVRLQSDWKGISRRQEDLLSGERKSRMQIENSLRASNDLIAQLASRLKRTEERAMEEHSTVSALVSHTKSVEQSIVNQQQDLLSKKESQQARVQELKAEVNEVMRMKDNLERISYALVDEVRQLKSKVDANSTELSATANDLKTRTRRLEDENKTGFEALRRNNETQQTSELSNTQLRTQVESRLSELRDVVVELRGRQEQANQDHHRLEQQLQMRLGDMTTAIQEQSRKREEAFHGFETVQREKDHSSEIEKTKLQGKITEIAEDVSKKILMKEIKLREELQQRYASLEAMMREESEAMHQFERDVKRELAEQVDTIKSMKTADLHQAEELIKADKKKQNETLQKLMEAQNLLDKQQEELKKQQDKIITAEIQSRKRHEKVTNEKMETLQEKLSVATATLQQALGGVSMQINAVAEKLEDENYEREKLRKKISKMSKNEDGSLVSQKQLIDKFQKQIHKMERDLQKIQGSVGDLKEEDTQSKIDKAMSNIQAHQNALSELKEEVDQVSNLSDGLGLKLAEGQKHVEEKYKAGLGKLHEIQNNMKESEKRQTDIIEARLAQKDSQHEEKLRQIDWKQQSELENVKKFLEIMIEELRREMKDMAVEGSTMGARTYTDLDARVTAASNKINQLEDLFDAKLQASTAVQAQNMREKVESISLWQEVTQQTLKEIQNQVQASSEEFYLADERQKLLKAEIKQRVSAESEARTRELEELKGKLGSIDQNLKDKEEENDKKMEEDDIENIQSSIRKLAESISTVKSVLSMKQQSEQKLRIEEVKALQNEVIMLRSMVESLLINKPTPRLFIKDEDGLSKEKAEKNALPINKWSMYTAYRWLVIKQRWIYLKWKRDFGAKNGPPLSWKLDKPNKIKDNEKDKTKGSNTDPEKKDDERKKDDEDKKDDQNSKQDPNDKDPKDKVDDNNPNANSENSDNKDKDNSAKNS